MPDPTTTDQGIMSLEEMQEAVDSWGLGWKLSQRKGKWTLEYVSEKGEKVVETFSSQAALEGVVLQAIDEAEAAEVELRFSDPRQPPEDPAPTGYDWAWDKQRETWAPEPIKPEAIPLPEGQARVRPEGGYDWAWNGATGDYDIRLGRTEETPKGLAQPEFWTSPDGKTNWVRTTPDGPWQRLQDDVPPTWEQAVMAQLIKGTPESLDQAQSIYDFWRQASPVQKYQLALDAAQSPVDYLTLVAMSRGELPPMAEPGTFNRIGPPSQVFDILGIPKAQQPGATAGTKQAVPPLQEEAPTPPAIASPSAPSFQAPSFAQPTDARESEAGRSWESGGNRYFQNPQGQVYSQNADTGDWDLQGEAEFQPPSFPRPPPPQAPGMREFDEFGNRVSQPPAPPIPITQQPGQSLAVPSFVQSQQAGLASPPAPQAPAAPTVPGQGRRIPSFLPTSVARVGLEGGALPQVQRQLPALGALRFPSAQAWRNMMPLEQEFFKTALKLQGVPLQDYQQQRELALPQFRERPGARFQPARIG